MNILCWFIQRDSTYHFKTIKETQLEFDILKKVVHIFSKRDLQRILNIYIQLRRCEKS